MAHWKKGDLRVYNILRNKKEYTSGKLTSEFTFAYEAHVTVLDVTKSGCTIEWIFQLPAKMKEQNPGYASTIPVYNGMKMVFKTSPEGEFEKLVNWQEVRDAYILMMEFSLPKEMTAMQKSSLEQTKTLFNNREMVESMLIKEIDIFYLPYGIKNSFRITQSLW